MATWKQLDAAALALPRTRADVRRGARTWFVGEKAFVWERPLRPREVAELGVGAPTGAVVAARVEHEGAKRALIAAEPERYFTTSHFDGFPAVLARLARLRRDDLDELVIEAWLARAPKRLAATLLSEREARGAP
jgi:hypothetical protein